MSVLTSILILGIIFGGIFLALRLSKKSNQDTPQGVIKKFEQERVKRCKYDSKTTHGVKYKWRDVEAFPSVEQALNEAYSEILVLLARKGWDASNGWIWTEAFTFYLFPEETKSLIDKVPSIIKPIDCSFNADYCRADSDPEKRLLTVNSNYEFDERGKILNKNVQALTVAGLGFPETFLTNDQRLAVVVPRDLTLPENFQLVKQGAYNELEHLVNCIFEPETFEYNNRAGHVHRIFG